MKIIANILVVTTLFCSPLVAQENRYHRTHELKSTILGEDRIVDIRLPKTYHSQSKYAYPILYVLDGESSLDYSVAVVNYLAENAVIPEMIVVGIHTAATRNKDFLPSAKSDQRQPADLFVEFMEKELFPIVNEEYRCAPLKILSGHSLGGLFVLNTMSKHPRMFNGYIARSPFLRPENVTAISSRMKDVFKNLKPFDSYAYFNLGDEPNLETSFTALINELNTSRFESFRLVSHIDKSKQHMTTRLSGQYAGLEGFFLNWPISNKELVAKKSLGFKQHINRLSNEFGYSVLYNERSFAQAAQVFLQQKDFNSANEVVEIYVKQHPNSVMANYFKGLVQISSGHQTAAAKSIDAAIDNYHANPNPALARILKELKAMRNRLK